MSGPELSQRDALTYRIIGCFFLVYRELGWGFLEAVYQRSMEVALRRAGLDFVSEAPLPVYFLGERIGAYRADLLVEGTVIIELKTASSVDGAHRAQLLNYLKATNIEKGLLFNFGPKPHYERFIFSNSRKTPRPLKF